MFVTYVATWCRKLQVSCISPSDNLLQQHERWNKQEPNLCYFPRAAELLSVKKDRSQSVSTAMTLIGSIPTKSIYTCKPGMVPNPQLLTHLWILLVRVAPLRDCEGGWHPSDATCSFQALLTNPWTHQVRHGERSPTARCILWLPVEQWWRLPCWQDVKFWSHLWRLLAGLRCMPSIVPGLLQAPRPRGCRKHFWCQLKGVVLYPCPVARKHPNPLRINDAKYDCNCINNVQYIFAMAHWSMSKQCVMMTCKLQVRLHNKYAGIVSTIGLMWLMITQLLPQRVRGRNTKKKQKKQERVKADVEVATCAADASKNETAAAPNVLMCSRRNTAIHCIGINPHVWLCPVWSCYLCLFANNSRTPNKFSNMPRHGDEYCWK